MDPAKPLERPPLGQGDPVKAAALRRRLIVVPAETVVPVAAFSSSI